jgi:hypothetical protein
MWRGPDPVEDFGRLASDFLWDLLDRKVDAILADMREATASTSQKLAELTESSPPELDAASG